MWGGRVGGGRVGWVGRVANSYGCVDAVVAVSDMVRWHASTTGPPLPRLVYSFALFLLAGRFAGLLFVLHTGLRSLFSRT